VAHPVFKTGGARHSALEGSTPSPFRMSDRDRLRDLPSVDRLATAVARAELQARREELLTGNDAGAGETVDLVARTRARLRPHLRRARGRPRHRRLARPADRDRRRLPDPEILELAGTRLVEVGTTNRTRCADYEAALAAGGEQIGAILRAHPSKFRTVGFVAEVGVEELCALGVPVIDDVGSGVLTDDLELLAGEPPVRRPVRAGAALTAFSGDKLLRGPQAGLLVGTREAVERCRRHPLARAVRIDKLSLAALEATLALHRDPAAARRALPVLAMLEADDATLRKRADELAAATGGTVVASTARVGGGALPLLELPGPVVAIDPGPAGADALAADLRAGDPAVVGRIHDGSLLLDPRTLTDGEAREAARAVRAVSP
jgi:L-seryl-tRNA(Ser) seleniumtransferase